ncbi:MAG: NAD(P)-dependent oxidoreductase [Eubacteriales bacterium]|nr:NAD(P)-dependent oxidoreductase [Eubacteriales bacterium]
MSKLAFFLDLTDWPCLVAGGSALCAERSRDLLEAGAILSCWSEDFSEGFNKLVANYRDQISLIRGRLDTTLLSHMLKSQQGPRLVVLATDEPELDLALWQVCEAHSVPACLPERPGRLDFGHTIDRGALRMAVSAETAPEVEEMLGRRMERELSRDWIEGSEAYAALRNSEAIKARHPDLRDPELRELAAALLDCNGRFAAARIRTERRLGKEFNG